ncbi:BON domain-containing protein [Burkholderia sp. PAMC 26561]|uniref:BON domain-containing protein n=1 Tax=Burkholderia sp. PAMC 26561 TaxID=1795043 RepID=UPI003FA4516D
MAWDVSVPPDAVGVYVENDWITLSGSVDRHFHREAAVQDVRRLLGVTDMTDHITPNAPINEFQVRRNLTQALKRFGPTPAIFR